MTLSPVTNQPEYLRNVLDVPSLLLPRSDLFGVKNLRYNLKCIIFIWSICHKV